MFIDDGKSAVEEVHDGGVDFRLHQLPVKRILVDLKLEMGRVKSISGLSLEALNIKD